MRRLFCTTIVHPLLALLLASLIGYLIGSIAAGYHYVKQTTGKDLRQIESGRTGGTNSFRAAGLKVGLLTGASDILKGAIAVWVATFVLQSFVTNEWLPFIKAAAGVGAVVGHNYSFYLGFKGGAGTTPNIGWALAIWWPVLPIALLLGVGLFYSVGMASVVSLAVGGFLPIVFGLRYLAGVDTTSAYLLGSLITAGLVTWALRPNIRRILDGNERIVGPRKQRMAKRSAQETFRS